MNESILKADVFFFVTTISVVVLTIGGLIALYYLFKIFKRINEISDHIQSEVLATLHDVKDARKAIREEGTKLKHVADFFINMVQKPIPKPRRKTVKVKSETVAE